MRHSKQRKRRLMALATGAAVMPACSGLAALLGQQVFPANYPWNQNISQAPVATNSATFIAKIAGTKTPPAIHPDWGTDNATNGTSPLYGIPYNVVHGNSTAKINVTIDNYPDQSDIVAVPIPTNAVIEGDYQNGPNPYGAGYNNNQRGDSHLIVWDEDNDLAYELYGASRPADTNTFNEVPNDGHWHAAQESVWNFKTNSFRPIGWTSADAAGLSILAGLVRPDEGLPVAQGGQGVINHALRMTLPAGDVSSQYIYPASHMVSESGIIPLGTRLRLRSNASVSNLIAAMGPQSQIIARAMQQYGLILADVGSAMFVTGTSAAENATNGISLTWNMANDVLDLHTLAVTNFDVVSLAPIVTGLSATNGPPGSAVTIQGQNFSGAAGNLAVFFGNTNVGPVTVLSDTQVVVTVPHGTGTVNVTVQSGTNETDYVSDSTNANVNAPIFGYGTSTLTATDKFAFVPSPTLHRVTLSGQKIIVTGTNNSGSGGSYQLLAATNLLTPRSNWTVAASGSFDASGNFAFTNAIAATNRQLFYILQAQ